MLKAVLFDLDNTLLDSDMRTFLPPYFAALAARMARFAEPPVFIARLKAAIGTMVENDDPNVTNREAFQHAFLPAFGDVAGDMQPEFDAFYEEDFPRLRYLTSPRAPARPLLELLVGLGNPLVIATNPLFPQRAVEHRLDWAGIAHIPFSRITTLENSHFCKPKPRYYVEILEQIGCLPRDALMVGDNLENDIRPSAAVGIHNYWIHHGDRGNGVEGLHGTLAEFSEWVSAGGSANL